jgi:hypothetical protein
VSANFDTGLIEIVNDKRQLVFSAKLPDVPRSLHAVEKRREYRESPGVELRLLDEDRAEIKTQHGAYEFTAERDSVGLLCPTGARITRYVKNLQLRLLWAESTQQKPHRPATCYSNPTDQRSDEIERGIVLGGPVNILVAKDPLSRGAAIDRTWGLDGFRSWRTLTAATVVSVAVARIGRGDVPPSAARVSRAASHGLSDGAVVAAVLQGLFEIQRFLALT